MGSGPVASSLSWRFVSAFSRAFSICCRISGSCVPCARAAISLSRLSNAPSLPCTARGTDGNRREVVVVDKHYVARPMTSRGDKPAQIAAGMRDGAARSSGAGAGVGGVG